MASKVLFATDFSERSGPAFQEALRLAKLMGAGIVVSHILHFPPMVGSAFLPNGEENEEAMRAWCNHRLDQLAADARNAGVAAEKVLREGANPAEGIVDLAAEVGTEVIVLGTHGRTGMGGMMCGSVSRQVVAEAPCPVVSVRAH